MRRQHHRCLGHPQLGCPIHPVASEHHTQGQRAVRTSGQILRVHSSWSWPLSEWPTLWHGSRDSGHTSTVRLPFAGKMRSNWSMRCFALLAMVVFTITCGPSPDAKLPGYSSVTSTGGSTDTGGTTVVSSGGTIATGGSTVFGSGGKTGSGGVTGNGGATSGNPGSGGRAGADAGPGGALGGRGGAGGVAPGLGGATIGAGGNIGGRPPASGGSTAGGGGVGGTTRGLGGGAGSTAGGNTGTHDAAVPSPDVSGACISQVVSNGYACGATPACSACKDQNGSSKEAGCKKSIDCLAAAGANCGSSCKQDCLNQAGDTPAMACVTALQTAACSGSGCGVTAPPNGGG